MKSGSFDTLSQAVNSLGSEGYKESFVAKGDRILASVSKKEYLPSELVIVKSFRFDGMTNPADESEVYALEAVDGTKGTLVRSYSAEQGQNTALIKKIKPR